MNTYNLEKQIRVEKINYGTWRIKLSIYSSWYSFTTHDSELIDRIYELEIQENYKELEELWKKLVNKYYNN